MADVRVGAAHGKVCCGKRDRPAWGTEGAFCQAWACRGAWLVNAGLRTGDQAPACFLRKCDLGLSQEGCLFQKALWGSHHPEVYRWTPGVHTGPCVPAATHMGHSCQWKLRRHSGAFPWLLSTFFRDHDHWSLPMEPGGPPLVSTKPSAQCGGSR